MLTPIPPSPSLAHEIENLRDQWGWFLALGIAMVVFGTIAIGSAVRGDRRGDRAVWLPAARRAVSR